MTTTAMRPDVLNPLFAEVEAMPGVGPKVAKLLAKLGIGRIVDLLYHLPTGSIERVRVASLDRSLIGSNVIVDLTPISYESSTSFL